MYKTESLKKVVRLANARGNGLVNLPADQIKSCISTGNKKIGRVLNVSMMPLLTCGNCKECSKLCYDIKACLQYPGTVIDARMRNTVLARYHRDVYFDRIDQKMSRRRTNKFFRWHVAGDILDLDYFERMVENARRHPDFVIWTYTKMYGIVNQYVAAHGGDRRVAIPKNMHIMFSEWDGMPMDNPYNFPVFACRLKDGNVSRTDDQFMTMFKCPGNCDICKAAHTGCVAGMDTYADEH